MNNYLNLITKIDDNGMPHGWNINPLTVLTDLEIVDFFVLKEQYYVVGGIETTLRPFIKSGLRDMSWYVVAHIGSKIWPFDQ